MPLSKEFGTNIFDFQASGDVPPPINLSQAYKRGGASAVLMQAGAMVNTGLGNALSKVFNVFGAGNIPKASVPDVSSGGFNLGGNTAMTAASIAFPELAPVFAAANALGVGGDKCDWICQLKKWFAETHFWQRVALVILALLLLGFALYLLAENKGEKLLTVAAKAAAK